MGLTLQTSSFLGSEVWTRSPEEHTGRQHPLVLQGTSGAGHAKPECQSGGFPGPFVCCQVRTACSVQRTGASVVAANRLHLEHFLKWDKDFKKWFESSFVLRDLCTDIKSHTIFSRVHTLRRMSTYELDKSVFCYHSMKNKRVQVAGTEPMWYIATLLNKTSVRNLRLSISLCLWAYKIISSEILSTSPFNKRVAEGGNHLWLTTGKTSLSNWS